jgi:hypothetical protein
MTDPAAIVRGLSDAQRRALMTARETVLLDRMKCAGKMKSMRDLGLTVSAWRGGDLLTTLGLAVRDALLNAASGGSG